MYGDYRLTSSTVGLNVAFRPKNKIGPWEIEFGCGRQTIPCRPNTTPYGGIVNDQAGRGSATNRIKDETIS